MISVAMPSECRPKESLVSPGGLTRRSLSILAGSGRWVNHVRRVVDDGAALELIDQATDRCNQVDRAAAVSTAGAALLLALLVADRPTCVHISDNQVNSAAGLAGAGTTPAKNLTIIADGPDAPASERGARR